eukprot:TRINITY_DN91067_c0_g1_i1.p1 TRINITY_DN91067_c0_g1~~TRINITY_DN91067_c0_g1_i1.p1  ORF type:complete len:298 (-),score=36.01 TRINITY_DN91067_c0_g1_i1:77-970(-)
MVALSCFGCGGRNVMYADACYLVTHPLSTPFDNMAFPANSPSFVPGALTHLTSAMQSSTMKLQVFATSGVALWSGEIHADELVATLQNEISSVVRRPRGTISLLSSGQELSPKVSFRTAVDDDATLTAVLLPMKVLAREFPKLHAGHNIMQVRVRRNEYVCDGCSQDVPGSYCDARDTFLYCEDCDFGLCWWCQEGDVRDGTWVPIPEDELSQDEENKESILDDVDTLEVGDLAQIVSLQGDLDRVGEYCDVVSYHPTTDHFGVDLDGCSVLIAAENLAVAMKARFLRRNSKNGAWS